MGELMKIGTDISLTVCRIEGYMVMEFKKRELIKKGKLDKDCEVTLSVSNPMAWTDSGKPLIDSGYDLWVLPPTTFSWNDLVALIDNPVSLYSVASGCDWKNCTPNFDDPTEYDLLNLASDIQWAIGLE